jgi:TolB-like protein
MRHVLAAALLAACLTGCAYQCDYRSKNLDLGKLGVVAVVPLENLSGRPDAGTVVAELLHAQLDSCGKLTLIPPEVVVAALDNQPPPSVKMAEGQQQPPSAKTAEGQQPPPPAKMVESQPPPSAKTQELGRLLGAKTLVIGRVTEYQYKHTLGEDPAIGVSIRVVDADTGTVLWSGARSDTGRIPWFKQDGLSRLTQSVCGALVESFLR